MKPTSFVSPLKSSSTSKILQHLEMLPRNLFGQLPGGTLKHRPWLISSFQQNTHPILIISIGQNDMSLSSNEAKYRTLETVRKQQRLWDIRTIQHHFLPQRAVIYQAIYHFSLQQSIFMHMKPRRWSRTRFYKQLITRNIDRWYAWCFWQMQALKNKSINKI